MVKPKILIIGAGLSGLSTAYFLKDKGLKPIIFEKNAETGGLCRSIKKEGFTFDLSGHLLHFRNKEILSLVHELLGDNLEVHNRNAWIYTFNKFVAYPFQFNLTNLPQNIAQECQDEFIKSRNNQGESLNGGNFLDWLNHNFGLGVTKHFMIPYNEKFWRRPLEDLTYKWAERFIVVPSLSDITGKGLEYSSQTIGYNAQFWYPKKGGIEGLTAAFSSRLEDIRLNSEVVQINLNEKSVKFKDGVKENYDILISTVPLPELGNIIMALPDKVTDSLGKLKWISIYNLNLGLEGNIESKRHWIYFPGKDVHFFRVGFFHNFSSHLVPQGSSSLYAEVSYSKEDLIDKGIIAQNIKNSLAKAGMAKDKNKIKVENINDIKYGYPVYDKNYTIARQNVLDFLSNNNVFSCGRYGSWRYLSMEDVIIESKRLIDYLCK